METEVKPREIEETKKILLQNRLIITHKEGRPAIEIRSLTTNPETIRQLVSSAYHRIPIIVMPVFTDMVQSLSKLVEKGILYIKKDDNNQDKYFFVED